MAIRNRLGTQLCGKTVKCAHNNNAKTLKTIAPDLSRYLPPPKRRILVSRIRVCDRVYVVFVVAGFFLFVCLFFFQFCLVQSLGFAVHGVRFAVRGRGATTLTSSALRCPEFLNSHSKISDVITVVQQPAPCLRAYTCV